MRKTRTVKILYNIYHILYLYINIKIILQNKEKKEHIICVL